ncbi:protein OCTOPUS-like [Gastrolobium bilobum]|uniref:protein OCTOPUS-like n=1 Tax=Gastrolobium bilobum TaxID=150636 RepID=UPI002AB10F54|nr:protein OCTOPUS-like [Gastrolobium bilobum]
MNPTAPPPQPPQPPLQPHRPSTSCDSHPEENFTGFCPLCLCERLTLLKPSSSPSPSSARKPPTSSSAATAALKAVFRPPSSSFFPELRRTKSFSASKNNEGFSGTFEPQRKSCDVRSTLWNLFNQDHNEKKTLNKETSRVVEAEAEVHVDSKNIASSSSSSSTTVQGPVVELKEEEKVEEEDDIRVLGEPNVNNEIVEEEEVVVQEEEEEFKTMKDHIDLDSSQAKKVRDLKEIAGSFWSAASVFSKKLQKWRQKQKLKKRRSEALPVEKPIGRQFRETQSEVADYGFGRRSCDTDPRFSLDAGRMSLEAGRMSLDDPRYSLDEPRASWDGYMIGKPGFLRMPTMLSVVEDAPVQHVLRTDTQIPVENEDDSVPGGSSQTREYYNDSSSRRRKSLDRSNSLRKSNVSAADMEELKSISVSIADNAHAKVTPGGVDSIHGVKMDFQDRDLSLNILRDDCCSETLDMGGSVIGNGDRKGSKKSRRWSKPWSIWGLIPRRGGNKDEDEDRYSRVNVNGVERSFSESWQEFRGGDGNGDGRAGFNGRVLLRSNSSVSWRNGQGVGGSFGTLRRNGVQGNGNGKKGKDEFVLERNKSARYSPNNVDNGLLRFYLTPMGGSRRNGSVKSRSNQAHSIARTVLGLF